MEIISDFFIRGALSDSEISEVYSDYSTENRIRLQRGPINKHCTQIIYMTYD